MHNRGFDFKMLMLRCLLIAGVALGITVAGEFPGHAQTQYERSDSLEARANRGDAAAIMMLGEMYERGDGVIRDPATAYYWYLLASEVYRPNTNPDDFATAIKRKAAIGQTLLPGDKANMESKAAAWRPDFVRRGEAKSYEVVPANEIEVDNRISAVTIYNDRAEVTRTAEVDLPAGEHVISFKGLPGILVPDSLRADGSAVASVTLGAVAQKEFMQKELSVPAEREIADETKKLQAELAGVEAEKAAMNTRKDMLTKLIAQANSQFGRDFSEANFKPDQWMAAAQSLHASMTEIMTALAKDEIKENDIHLNIDRVQRRRTRVYTGTHSTHGVTIPVETEKPTKLTIQLSYQVPNAGWRPLYDAHLAVSGDDKGKVSFTQYGVAWQRTGEDWKGVALTLSTAQPQRDAVLPDLQARWLDIYEKPKNEPPDLSSEEYQRRLVENTTQSMIAIPVDSSSARASSAGFVSIYKIDRPSDVPADGTETKLLMGEFEAESKVMDYVRPQLGSEAYLVARIKLKGDVSLLPGQVNLFRDEAYVGNLAMPLMRPGEERDLYFGVDDEVVVMRETLKNERKEAGVIAPDNILERSYVTSLQNLHKDPVNIVVRETVPVSRSDKLKVDILKDGPTTPDFKEDADNVKGQLAWRFPLQPHEKRNIKLGWSLNWPSGYLLQGLPN